MSPATLAVTNKAPGSSRWAARQGRNLFPARLSDRVRIARGFEADPRSRRFFAVPPEQLRRARWPGVGRAQLRASVSRGNGRAQEAFIVELGRH